MYTVIADPSRHLMRVRVDGFWNMQTMVAYAAELQRCSRELSQSGGCQRILVDMGDYPIQSQDIAHAHVEAMRYATERLGARVALVMRSSLSRLQASRLARDTGHAFFDDEDQAMAWLIAG